MSENHGRRLPKLAWLCCIAPNPHLNSDFSHVFPSLLAAYFTASSSRWEISHTLSRISRKSVQSTEVPVIITSLESPIITIWHMFLFRMIFHLKIFT